MERLAGRREDHAEVRRAVADQADIDGIIVAAADEFLGAVERIDQEIGVAVGRNSARGDFFLGDHRHAGRGAGQRRQDDQLGRAVGFGDRRTVAFVSTSNPRRTISRIASPGFARGVRDLVEKLR